MSLLVEQQLAGAFGAGQLHHFAHEPNNPSDVAGIPDLSQATPWPDQCEPLEFPLSQEGKYLALVNWCG